MESKYKTAARLKKKQGVSSAALWLHMTAAALTAHCMCASWNQLLTLRRGQTL